MNNWYQRYCAWVAQHCPPFCQQVLQLGTSSAALEQLETLIRRRLPEDFKAFYRCGNGQAQAPPYLMDSTAWLSIEAIQQQWQRRQQAGVWAPTWVPFTSDGYGHHYGLDLSFPKNRTFGAVFSWYVDTPALEYLAPSFEAFVSGYVEDLEAGHYQYIEAEKAIVFKTEII